MNEWRQTQARRHEREQRELNALYDHRKAAKLKELHARHDGQLRELREAVAGIEQRQKGGGWLYKVTGKAEKDSREKEAAEKTIQNIRWRGHEQLQVIAAERAAALDRQQKQQEKEARYLTLKIRMARPAHFPEKGKAPKTPRRDRTRPANENRRETLAREAGAITEPQERPEQPQQRRETYEEFMARIDREVEQEKRTRQPERTRETPEQDQSQGRERSRGREPPGWSRGR